MSYAAATNSVLVSPIDEYIATKPEFVQQALRAVLEAVRATAPDACETIAYGMPALKENGTTIASFGAFKAHVGFYPGAAAVRAFSEELRGYHTARGSIRFPLDEPIPVDLIQRLTRFKSKQIAKAKAGERS